MRRWNQSNEKYESIVKRLMKHRTSRRKKVFTGSMWNKVNTGGKREGDETRLVVCAGDAD